MTDIENKIKGCFLGHAIGDSLGSIANGLSPFEVMSKYSTPINSFYNGSQYTGETRSFVFMTQELLKESPSPTNVSNWIKGNMDEKVPGLVFSKMIPLALLAVLQAKEDGFLIAANKAVNPGLKKSEGLAIFIYMKILSELLLHPVEYQKPSELYDADNSLLSRMVKLTIEIEGGWELEDLEYRLSDRLDFTRKKLMKHLELPCFMGLNDNRNMAEVLTNVLFAYMNAPDDVSTIYKIISMGKVASINGALVGALIGTTIGADSLPLDLKDNLPKNKSGELQELASKLCNRYGKE